MVERKIVYFDELKPENTDIALAIALERAKALKITKIVLASTTGATARKAMDLFKDSGIKLIVVPHQFDFHRTQNLFPPELAAALRAAGHDVHFATMLFHTSDLYESNQPTLMANLLRCFCQGVKVCFEIVLMTTDAGLVGIGEKVIAVAGTGRGSDTALVMQAASSQHLRHLRVNEILCKPLNPINIDELMEKIARKK